MEARSDDSDTLLNMDNKYLPTGAGVDSENKS